MHRFLLSRRHIIALAGLCVLWAIQTSLPAAEPVTSSRVTTPDELAAWIDGRIADHFAKNSVAQPPLVDDATFLRRAYLDLVGTLPAVSEVRDFLADQSELKRTRLIDRLLDDPRFAPHQARTWRRVLVSEAAAAATFGEQVEQWLTEQIGRNAAFDELARKLIIAGGAEPAANADEEEDEDSDQEAAAARAQASAVSYLRSTGGDPASVAGSVSRIFLGVRIECAQCHDHPFTDWKQQDFWGIAAFFAGARYNRPAPPPAANGNDRQRPPTTDERLTSITPPDIGRSYEASVFWDGETKLEIPDDKLPRQVFADWLTSPKNPHFAATAVNRIWQQLCGQGLTESVDDLDRADKVARAVVLDDLAVHFADRKFDLKWLISGVCRSKAYQFAANATPSESAKIRVRPLKVLAPEQVFDSLEIALGLPISRLDDGPRFNGQRNEMIARLGETTSSSPDKFRGGIPQMLMLMNGVVTAEATSLDTSRTLRAVVDAPFLDDAEKIQTLFLATLTRPPSALEASRLKEHIEKRAARGENGQAYAEILWALINSPEFMLIR